MKANGEILRYHLGIIQDYRNITEIRDIRADKLNQNYSMMLPPGKVANIEITAANSVGVSPKATLFIPRSHQGILKTAIFLISYKG